MIQTDKERLAISGAIALLLYGGIFAATGWLNILNPAPPRDYVGPLSVEVTLQRPEPQTILPPEVEKPEPEVIPEPVTEPQTTPPPAANTAISVPSTVTESTRAEPSPPAVEPAASTGQSATESVPAAAPEPSQAVIVKSTQYLGESETVSANPADIGRDVFESVREETPTDLRGETTLVFGADTLPVNPSTDPTPALSDTDEPSFADWSQLDLLVFRGEGNGSGTGDGSGTERSTAEPAGDLIEADNLDELISQRGVVARNDPDLSNSELPDGLRSMKVPVEFTIRSDGVVIAVRVADTGNSDLNVKIAQALRGWKFAPIQQDLTQTARLLYLIRAGS